MTNQDLLPKTIKPLSKQDAVQFNQYLKVKDADDASGIQKFLDRYAGKYLYVTARNKKEYVICMQAKGIDMYTVYDAGTGDMLHEIISLENLLTILLGSNHAKERFSEDEKTSIFLDEYNLAYYKRTAEEIKRKYGCSKARDDYNEYDLPFTGDEYRDRIDRMARIAEDIIDGNLVPDLFKRIPLKKNGTFTANRKIPIFKYGLYDAMNCQEYIEKIELVLCIVTQDTFDYGEKYDMSEEPSQNRARLAIAHVNGTKKICPLLDKDLNVNDIVTKAAYLKNDQVKQGNVYKEKSGTEHLYLGNICILDVPTDKIETSGRYYEQCRPVHTYIRMTKKIQKLVDESASLDEFLQAYIRSSVKEYYDTPNFSERENPHKFTEETAVPFANRPFSITNKPETRIANAKPLFTQTVFYSRENKDIDVNWYVIQN